MASQLPPSPAAAQDATGNAGSVLMRHLKRRGIDHLYLNAGTDFAPLVGATADAADAAAEFPLPVLCAEETVAIGMAHGHYLATGKPQAAMVHVNVGTAKALCGLINAARDNSPLLLLAGRNPVTQEGHVGSRSMFIHWAQEMFDQGSMVREFVKWDYEVRDPSQVQAAIDRALEIAMAEPRGPVYLMLPREMLASAYPPGKPPAELSLPTPPGPDPDAIARLAKMIDNAEFPVLLVCDVGRRSADRELLAELAERNAIAVVESSRALVSNLPSGHPMHLGCDASTALAHADLIVVCGADAPWIPSLQAPKEGAVVVHLGPDPVFSTFPFRHFPSSLNLTSAYGPALRALSVALVPGASTPARARRIAAVKEARAERRRARIADALGGPAITKSMLNAILDRVKPRDAVVVNEYWMDRELVDFAEPGTYFCHSPAGGLGWGLPAALGVQHARPQALVIATVGDGAYMFANPAACHHAAANYGLPVLTVIYNNSKWEAVQRATLQLYPRLGEAQHLPLPMTSLGTMPDFCAYATASGGYAETVREKDELEAALKRSIAVVQKEHRQALLNVIGT